MINIIEVLMLLIAKQTSKLRLDVKLKPTAQQTKVSSCLIFSKKKLNKQLQVQRKYSSNSKQKKMIDYLTIEESSTQSTVFI
jgi:hypothetical protein